MSGIIIRSQVASLLSAIDNPDIYGALSQATQDKVEVVRVNPSPTAADVRVLWKALGEGCGIHKT